MAQGAGRRCLAERRPNVPRAGHSTYDRLHHTRARSWRFVYSPTADGRSSGLGESRPPPLTFDFGRVSVRAESDQLTDCSSVETVSDLRDVKHPVPRRIRGLVALASLAIASVLLVLMFGRLEATDTPLGVVDLEFAGTQARAREILRLWTERGVGDFLPVSLILDIPFIVAYSLGLSTLCAIATERFGRGSAAYGLGIVLTAAQWIAGGFDLLEDAALSTMVGSVVTDPWPRVAQVCALAKFALISLGAVYIVIGWIATRGPVARSPDGVAAR